MPESRLLGSLLGPARAHLLGSPGTRVLSGLLPLPLREAGRREAGKRRQGVGSWGRKGKKQGRSREPAAAGPAGASGGGREHVAGQRTDPLWSPSRLVCRLTRGQLHHFVKK